MIDENFWKAKRVFLTGHTGFKGSWLSLWLQLMGAEVFGFALEPPTKPSLFEAAGVGKRMISHISDVRDLNLLTRALTLAQPHVVFHLAAQPLVRYSYEYPVDTFSTNVMGTVNILEACRNIRSLQSIVIVTTDKCYENRETDYAYCETDPMGGSDPYSASKACAELVTASYRKSFFKTAAAVSSARAGNVIGGGDWAMDRLVPDVVNCFNEGRPVKLRNPQSVRPWQHVLESTSGYLLLAQKLALEGSALADAYNFGPASSDCKSVGEVVSLLAELWGSGAKFEIDSSAHPHEARLLKLDSSKSAKVLNWHPTWNLQKSLEKSSQWYKEYFKDQTQAAELTLGQIRDFWKGTN